MILPLSCGLDVALILLSLVVHLPPSAPSDHITSLLNVLPAKLNYIPISSLRSLILLLSPVLFLLFSGPTCSHLCYRSSVGFTFSIPHRHAGVTHALSVPPSQHHTGMPALRTLCQCHRLNTTQACRRYPRSVSATVSTPHRHAGGTHALSVPPSQHHTGMPALRTLCQCHRLNTTQACRRYARSVSAIVSTPHRDAGVTHALSVPPSQHHTGMPALHTLCQCHRLNTTQACRRYARSVSATVSTPHRHAGVTHALSVPPSQHHTGIPALRTLCQCHRLNTTQACRRYTRSVSATVSTPHRHAGVTHALSVPSSQDHTGMPALRTLCQCHRLNTTQACRRYTCPVSAIVSRPHSHTGVTHALIASILVLSYIFTCTYELQSDIALLKIS